MNKIDLREPDEFEVAYMRFDLAVTRAMMAKLRHWVSGNNSV